MTDRWAEAYYPLVQAIERAKEAGVDEDEILSAVDDVYHEKAEDYEARPKKPKKGINK